jgi:hypothetical protein
MLEGVRKRCLLLVLLLMGAAATGAWLVFGTYGQCAVDEDCGANQYCMG